MYIFLLMNLLEREAKLSSNDDDNNNSKYCVSWDYHIRCKTSKLSKYENLSVQNQQQRAQPEQQQQQNIVKQNNTRNYFNKHRKRKRCTNVCNSLVSRECDFSFYFSKLFLNIRISNKITKHTHKSNERWMNNDCNKYTQQTRNSTLHAEQEERYDTLLH